LSEWSAKRPTNINANQSAVQLPEQHSQSLAFIISFSHTDLRAITATVESTQHVA
jgi:hypothetical protein